MTHSKLRLLAVTLAILAVPVAIAIGVSDHRISTASGAMPTAPTLTVPFWDKPGQVLCWGKNGPGRRDYGYVWVDRARIDDTCTAQP